MGIHGAWCNCIAFDRQDYMCREQQTVWHETRATPSLPGRAAYRTTLDCDACHGGDCDQCGGSGVVDDEGDVFARNELQAREVPYDAGLSEGERRAMDDEQQRGD